MLRFSFIILAFLYDIATGSDLEVQARVHMNPDFLKRMEKTLRVQTAILRAGNSLSHELSEKFGDKEPENDNNNILEDLRPQFSRNNQDEKTIREIHEERLEKKGIEGIESVAEYLRLKFNFKLDESVIKESCEQFVAKLRSYFKFMLKKEASIAVEKEGIVLDKVDMAIVLQSSFERALLEEVLANNNISNSEKYIMTEAVFLFSMRNKQNEMKYICKTMGICRPFPGFSDQLAQIMSEVLKLYDVKFQYFVIKAAQLIVSKKHFLKIILRDEIYDFLKEKADNIVDADMNDMRENISVVRSVIIERHRVVNVADEAVKIRTKAVRIVFDIIDTVFDRVGMDEVQIRVEALITGIQDWAANLVTDIEPILSTFITDSVTNIKYELNSIGRDEINVLIDIIYFGEPKGNQYVAEYLMITGSKFKDGIEKSEISNFRLKLNKKLAQIL